VEEYRSFYSPTYKQLNCLKNNFKIYIKTAPTCFGTVTPSSGSALFELAKVTVVKNNQLKYIGVVSLLLWLHMQCTSTVVHRCYMFRRHLCLPQVSLHQDFKLTTVQYITLYYSMLAPRAIHLRFTDRDSNSICKI
jgi:hypothetical protein